MTGRWRTYLRVAVLLLAATIVSSCSRAPGPCLERDAGDHPVDPTLLAFLSRARAAHHLADMAEASDVTAATRALAAVVSGPIPQHLGLTPPEAREVLADTQARIAELESRQGQFDTATRRVSDALELVPEVSYFRGHLFETLGIIHQRRAEELTRAGDEKASQTAKLEALAAFESAMQIQAEVIRLAAPSGSATRPSGEAGSKGLGAKPVAPSKGTSQ